jgi:carboxyl-terminal processing protease
VKKNHIIFFAAALAAGLILGFVRPAQGRSFFQGEIRLISTVAALVEAGYVQEVAPSRMLRGAMNGLLKTLDPYSLYLDKEAYAEFKADNEGRFVGTGMEVSVQGGVLHVIAPLDGSPAAQAGVKAGDVIQKIDGVVTKEMALGDAVKMLRGAPGSKVTLTLLRDGSPAPFERAVERRLVNAEGVREARMLDGAAYVRIAEFQKRTAADFKKASEELKLKDSPGLVIDLRNNPGGLLDGAVEVAQNFIPKGELIVVTKGRLKSKNREYRSKQSEVLKPGPIAVLVNKGSASGSEILAGVVQDYGLGRVFGKKTYGKGCVQTLTPLPDGSAVRITTSHYYTPKGRLIHEIGITPDEVITEDPAAGEDKALAAALAWIKSERVR